MNNDIVTRLRGQRTNAVICKQAADEIERLRGLAEELLGAHRGFNYCEERCLRKRRWRLW